MIVLGPVVFWLWRGAGPPLAIFVIKVSLPFDGFLSIEHKDLVFGPHLAIKPFHQPAFLTFKDLSGLVTGSEKMFAVAHLHRDL